MTNSYSPQLSKLTVLLQYTNKTINDTNSLMNEANKQLGQVKDFIIQTDNILNPSVKNINKKDETFIQKLKKHLFSSKDENIDSSLIMQQLQEHYKSYNIENVLLNMKATEQAMLKAKQTCLDLFESNQNEIKTFEESIDTIKDLNNAEQKNEYQNTNPFIKSNINQNYNYLKSNDNNLEQQILLDFETQQQILHNLTMSINLILDNFVLLLNKTSDFIHNGTTHKALEIKTILDKMISET